jgi:hypothetical protein
MRKLPYLVVRFLIAIAYRAIAFLIWHPLAAAAIVFTAGDWGAGLLHGAVNTGPRIASSLGRLVVLILGALWGACMTLLSIRLAAHFVLPGWQAAPLCCLGFIATGYLGWAELPRLKQDRDSTLRSMSRDSGNNEELIQKANFLNNLLENIGFFRIASLVG